MFRILLTFTVFCFFQVGIAQNEASAGRTEMIAKRIDASSFDSFTMQSFELSCFENEAPGEIKVLYSNHSIQKIIYSYEISAGIGEISYYFFKEKLNYVDHVRYKFEYIVENDSINYDSKTLESRHQVYFNGTEKVFEKTNKRIKTKEHKDIDYFYYAEEMKKAAVKRIKLLEKN